MDYGHLFFFKILRAVTKDWFSKCLPATIWEESTFWQKGKTACFSFLFRKDCCGNCKWPKAKKGRWIGEIFFKNQNLGKELVRTVLAWHFMCYSKSENYADLEMEARKNKLILWKEKEPIAPWEWRKFKKRKFEIVRI